MANVLLHMGLGILLTIVALRYLLKSRSLLPPVARWGLVLFVLAAIPGLVIIKLGGLRPYRWILQLHIALAFLAVFVLGFALRSLWKKGPSSNLRFAWRGYSLALPTLFLFPLGVAVYRHYVPSEWDRIRNPVDAPTSMYEEGDGAKSPFFPSSATTTPPTRL